ncbi:MAG: glycosyl transferase family 2 [Bacteroidetes bacterium GWF2_41_9]|nr:MAG: glycosyl transferase family 2 [Bacteroidetes bacterium GWF2_41_9]HAM11333.1 glycosyl transferase family 2 [Bacteroidales bacterium]HBH82812.1 glycosyl transferase family 2 [Bacteroidales bacterium]HBQ82864.1 glycosyl transferase family 2 [Bacteroidales bacterium]HCU19627.1 glycosyl transferase family 2 [Bacteroidales bacterium]
MISKFLKFCVVGSSGMVIDFGTTWLLKERIKINKYAANSTGFILAASSNYFLNRIWTFQNHDPAIATQYISFILISVVGLGINNLVIYLLNDRLRYNFYLSKLFAIAVVTIWNFLMNFIITFR